MAVPEHRAARQRATALGSPPDHTGVFTPLGPFALPLLILFVEGLPVSLVLV